MNKPTTISFDKAKDWMQLGELLNIHATPFAQNGIFTFYYFSSSLEILAQYLDKWTFPRLSLAAKEQQIGSHLTAFAVVKNNQLVGTAVIHHPKPEVCQLVCFLIMNGYRNEGIGQLFLQEIEKIAQKAGYGSIQVNWRNYWKCTDQWIYLLKKYSWQPQASKMYYVILPKSAILKIQQTYRYQREVAKKHFTFEEVNEKQLHLLQQCFKNPEWKAIVPQALNPFQLLHLLDYQASILIKKEGKIVGWLMVHRLKPEVWQVTSVFLLPAYRKEGITLFTEMLERHQNRGKIHFMIQPHNRKMLVFMQRYILPHQAKIYEQKVHEKAIL